MERESPEQEARRLLAESTARLQEMKDDKEAFGVSLELAGMDLESAEVAFERGDTEASQREVMQALERMHSSLRDALSLTPPFVTPESMTTLGAMLDKVNNLRITCWQWGKRLEQEYEAKRDAMGNPACPIMIYEGIARVASEMASPEATEFCLNRCSYADRCDPNPKP